MPDFRRMKDREEGERKLADHYRVSTRKVAMWSAVIALGSVAAVILVATVQNANALNTIALYLAIIAFIAQLIMFIAQNESSSRQLSASKDVQRGTSVALRGIEETAGNIQRLLNEQYGVVINALVERATDAAAERLSGPVAPGEAAEGASTDEGAGGSAAPALTREELRAELRAELAHAATTALESSRQSAFIPLASGAVTGGAALYQPNHYVAGLVDQLEDANPYIRAAGMQRLYDEDRETFDLYFGPTRADRMEALTRMKDRRAAETADGDGADDSVREEHREAKRRHGGGPAAG
jgi:heme/copper-type cytochrome/quinol oxidase subunit 4